VLKLSSEKEVELRGVLAKIIKETHDMVSSIVFAWRDGIPVSYISSEQPQAEFLAVASAAALGSLDALGDIFGSRVKRVDVEFENGEHVIISTIDGSFIALSSTPRPNLGLIHLVLRKYEDEVIKIAGVGQVDAKRLPKNTG
jgi:predicted regulator of Ras-like GTPase activity (Roadblock/LC7/MglB family)